MAVLWLVLQLTGSAKLMATVSLVESIHYVLVGFFAAGIVTRSKRLRAMIALDVTSAAFVIIVPVTYLLGVRSVLLLCTVAAILSSLEAVFDPALQSVPS